MGKVEVKEEKEQEEGDISGYERRGRGIKMGKKEH